MGSDKSHRELKQLRFVRIIAVKILVWISNLYENVKKRSPGPLKSAVGAAERAVNVVIAPVYEEFKGVPDHLLAFFDEKADGVVKRFDKYVPACVKQYVNKARSMAQKALEVAQKVMQKTRAGGPRAAICYLINLLMTSVMRFLARFWFDKLPFAGAIGGVFGELIPMKGVASVVGHVAGAVEELVPVKGVASAVGHVAGAAVGGVGGAVFGGAAGAVGELKKGVGGVVGNVGDAVGGVTSAVEKLVPLKGVAGAVEGLFQ